MFARFKTAKTNFIVNCSSHHNCGGQFSFIKSCTGVDFTVKNKTRFHFYATFMKSFSLDHGGIYVKTKKALKIRTFFVSTNVDYYGPSDRSLCSAVGCSRLLVSVVGIDVLDGPLNN